MKNETNSLGRRAFLKMSFAAGLVANLSSTLIGSQRPVQCRHCKIKIALKPKLISHKRYCRNCGADAFTDQTNLPILYYKKNTSKSIFMNDQLGIPFPNPEIQVLTTKPCFSRSQIRPNLSKIRQIPG